MRLCFILAFICKTLMVWPGANNQLDYKTVPDIQKYYLDGSKNDLMVSLRTCCLFTTGDKVTNSRHSFQRSKCTV